MGLYADAERGRYPIWQSIDHASFSPGSGILFVTVTVGLTITQCFSSPLIFVRRVIFRSELNPYPTRKCKGKSWVSFVPCIPTSLSQNRSILPSRGGTLIGCIVDHIRIGLRLSSASTTTIWEPTLIGCSSLARRPVVNTMVSSFSLLLRQPYIRFDSIGRVFAWSVFRRCRCCDGSDQVYERRSVRAETRRRSYKRISIRDLML